MFKLKTSPFPAKCPFGCIRVRSSQCHFHFRFHSAFFLFWKSEEPRPQREEHAALRKMPSKPSRSFLPPPLNCFPSPRFRVLIVEDTVNQTIKQTINQSNNQTIYNIALMTESTLSSLSLSPLVFPLHRSSSCNSPRQPVPT